MRLAAYLLWIPGLFAVIAAVIFASMGRGGKRTRSWALRFGLALFAASALLLTRAGGPSG